MRPVFVDEVQIAADPELVARVRLSATPGLTPRTMERLVTGLGSARAAVEASAARWRAAGLGSARADLRAALPSIDEASAVLARAHAGDAEVMAPHLPAWPAALADLSDPPPLLFVRGELQSDDARGVAIVGARRATPYGRAQATRLGRELAERGLTVVSGLARGVDAAAHRGALAGGGRTVAVLGGGLARLYPPEHVDLAREIAAGRGAVITEFALDMPPLPYHFPRRNRLIAALSAAVVVVEAGEKSGSLITADHALDIGREVLAVPGRVDAPLSRGVLRLLREGAAPCAEADDVLRALGVEVPDRASVVGAARAPPGASPAERALLDGLEGGEFTADELLETTGLGPSEGLAALSSLELRGLVTLCLDGRYRSGR